MFSYFFTDQLYLGLAEKVFWLGLGVRSQESGVRSQEFRSQEKEEEGRRRKKKEEE
jgi:hypothetical protein